MAQIGLKNIYYAIVQSDTAEATTYGTPVKLSQAISVDINPSIQKATLYGDDAPIAANTSLTEITVTIETADIPLEAQAHLLGHTIDESDTLIAKASDSAPYVGLMFESEMHNGNIRCVKLYKGKFAPTQETINTRGESLEYQVPKIEGSFVARESDGAWKKVHDFLKNSPTDVWYQDMN